MFRTLLLAVLALGASSVSAKNLDGRLGFGVTYLGFSQSAGMSLKYFHDPLLATFFAFGFSTETSQYVIGAKSLRNVVLEENMNLFLGIAAFFLSGQDAGGQNSFGAEFDALFGSEFFLSGLPNLGFQFEVGLGLRAMRVTSFRSVGGGFANGSIHYYF